MSFKPDKGILCTRPGERCMREDDPIWDKILTYYYFGCGCCGDLYIRHIPLNETIVSWSLD
jgi:hypothetical protein